MAFNGNGDGLSNHRLVSLAEGGDTAAGRALKMTRCGVMGGPDGSGPALLYNFPTLRDWEKMWPFFLVFAFFTIKINI